jgi:hypothetical protein
MTWKQMTLDRVATPELMDLLQPGGIAHSLVERRNKNLSEPDPSDRLLDLQLRRRWASLYVGLTTVIDLHASKSGYRIKAHPTWKAFAPHLRWGALLSKQELGGLWPDIEAYLDTVVSEVPKRRRGAHLIEGRVHAAICSGVSDDYRVLNRETSHSFKSVQVREDICAPITDSIYSAVESHSNTEKWWPGVRYNQKEPRSKRLGTSPDVLAVDKGGRLLVMEAKPAKALDGIAWGPAQVSFYAQLFAHWIANADSPHKGLQMMLEQRRTLGLTPNGGSDVQTSSAVVSILAIGPGKMSPSALGRSREVARVLNSAPLEVSTQSIELWQLDAFGSIATKVDP